MYRLIRKDTKCLSLLVGFAVLAIITTVGATIVAARGAAAIVAAGRTDARHLAGVHPPGLEGAALAACDAGERASLGGAVGAVLAALVEARLAGQFAAVAAAAGQLLLGARLDDTDLLGGRAVSSLRLVVVVGVGIC